MRRHNVCRLLRHLHPAGAQSRPSLTMSMRLNRSTIADLVGEVELLGLARQQPPEPGPRDGAGRPSVGVTSTDHAYVLGLGGCVLATAAEQSPPAHDRATPSTPSRAWRGPWRETPPRIGGFAARSAVS